jgi:hypothetical protein
MMSLMAVSQVWREKKKRKRKSAGKAGYLYRRGDARASYTHHWAEHRMMRSEAMQVDAM